MADILGVLLFSFGVTFLAAIPFINLLYRLKFQRQREQQKDIFGVITSIVNRLHGWKVGTPNAGGVLIIIVSIVLSAVFYKLVPGYDIRTKLHGVNWAAVSLYLTLILFGALGLYDDLRKFYGFGLEGVWGLRLRYKFILQWAFALFIGWILYSKLGFSSIHVPVVDSDLNLGAWYILFSAFVIVATSNAVNITDGLDGLATGLTIITLSAFWVLASFSGQLDTVLFIAVMMGSLLAFLYFNIFPARVWLGDTGALALGAMIAVIALVLNASLVLPFIGLVFLVETLSSLLQWLSKAIRGGKKIFLSAPVHHHFEAKGWDETKVTMRFWLAGAVSAFIGLFLAFV
ncbi:MAG: phospho-N-acetylmuramoyl-pentapeptide-transferase [Candidatus Woykebacteria bacterium]